ncbi:HTH domain-containing protein [Microvirga guangxiensis]|uniref:Predicted phosphoesterase, NUDIX family n=1 Tax=Microvirga guangxiensis TaxID=549386 RepID=A0A1G5F5B7_9HYPH|nr:HTH domain-containing protein [Microvirga guangxiensis]SCY34439.1 Predicted phosphoesterase, NUDIX family [Microvirga guangxiensis]
MSSRDDLENTTYLWVAETVLARQKRPLRAGEIVRIGLDDGLFGDKVLSRTPQKSMQARLSMDILRHQQESRFLRTGRGRFFLRSFVENEPDPEAFPTALAKPVQEYIAPRRTPLPSTERVLVISKADYARILDFQGINLAHGEILSALLSAPSLTYMNRALAETNNDFKQVVTYVVIQSGDRVLSFRRGTYNRAASFLRGALCIGFGGHVNEDDLDIFSYQDRGIRANAVREIGEELRLKSGPVEIQPHEIEPIGILNDDSSEIGRRHLAVVLRYRPSTLLEEWEHPLKGEASINQIRWVSPDRKPINLPEYEYWSQLCLRKLFPAFASGEPSYLVRRRSAFAKDHALCVVGSIGSGKSVATAMIRRTCGYAEINTGRVLAGILGVPPVPETDRREFQSLAQEFIERPHGPSLLAERIASEIASCDSRRVIVDGLRHTATLERLREVSPLPLAMVYIQTPPDVAFELYRLREGRDGDMSAAEFMDILHAPVEAAVPYLISEADAIIYNWFGIDSYKSVVASFVADAQLSGAIDA